MTILLTDDEAVAIAATRTVEFPARLPTVARIPGEMVGAAVRGARSLMVRGLAAGEVHELVVADEASALIEPFIGSGRTFLCFSYSTVSSFPVPAGSARPGLHIPEDRCVGSCSEGRRFPMSSLA